MRNTLHAHTDSFICNMQKLITAISILSIVLFSISAYAKDCCPTRIVDGDTFHFRPADADVIKVRIVGFDAPERGQPFGKVATERLKELIGDGATCDCKKTDKYGRSLCLVRGADGRDVATSMLQDGLGCIDPRFVKDESAQDQKAHRQALNQAQTTKIGIWSMPEPECAKEYRDKKRETQRQNKITE